MNFDILFIVYFIALFIGVIFLSKFIYEAYITFAKKYNLVETLTTGPSKKIKIYSSSGLVFAITLLVSRSN